MATITIWLLISVGQWTHVNAGSVSTPTNVIERFATVEACDFVASAIRKTSKGNEGTTPVVCVQATVIKP